MLSVPEKLSCGPDTGKNRLLWTDRSDTRGTGCITYVGGTLQPRLRKYVSERAKIIPRRVTGTCAFHQRELTVAIKRARYMALMPYVSD